MVSRAVEGLCCVLEAGEFVAAAAACSGAQGPSVCCLRLAASLLLIFACAKVCLLYGVGQL